MEEMMMQTKAARKEFYYVGVCLFVGLLVSVAVQFAYTFVVMFIPGLGESFMETPLFLWTNTIFSIYLIGLPLTLLLLRRHPAEAPEKKTLPIDRFFGLLPVSLFLMYLGSIIGSGLSWLLSGGEAEDVVSQALAQKHILMYISTLVCAPVMEELVFRKAILDRTRKYGEKLALVLSAVAFGLFHMNFFQFFYAFFLGLLLGYVYLRTGKIRYTMLLHCIINFFGGVITSEVADYTMVEEGAVATYNQSMVSMVFFLFIAYMFVDGAVRTIRRSKCLEWAPTAQPLMKGKVFSAVYLNLGMILYICLCALFMAISLL